ncbi:MobA/MobL family protein (plasmid) [Roseibium porphyridii]|uniref:MobA/MobL family protein n=1 Tax=Roseibium porphyridii TaxID=2866279 RepID=A0ABY8FAX7_9HYPH|nr:MobA/MobL family protein [Roseibium sp. KMA01]WFE92653.1 MobA/MobL family protein [Roseibium sp. KMA01]
MAASAYRARDNFTDKRTGDPHDYTHKAADLAYSEMLWPTFTPLSTEPKLANGKVNPTYSREYAARFSHEFKAAGIYRIDIRVPVQIAPEIKVRENFWNFVEMRLTHPRAQPAFEIEVMLPRELTREQNIELVRRFSFDHFVSEGLVVDLNIHEKTASDGLPHPHAHLLISTRRINPHGDLGKVASDMQDSPLVVKKIYALEQAGKLDEAHELSQGTNLMQFREAWARYANDALADTGSLARIDHRTLAEQGFKREATPNIGFAINNHRTNFKGYDPERVARFDAVKFRNTMRKRAASSMQMKLDPLEEFLRHAKELTPHLIHEFDITQEDIDHER